MADFLLPQIETDFALNEPFTLVSGEVLPSLKIRYAIYGELNAEKSNVVLVFHALTGSARIADWWSGIIGAGKALDTANTAFICANALGSCYGSTCANEINSIVTTRDMARANAKLLDYLEIEKLQTVIGGSVGGMLALQFATDFPARTAACVSIGATPLSAMGLALNHLQREAVRLENGVSLARQIAMISYKSAELFDARFARQPNRNGENPAQSLAERFDVAGYLDYQGAKFARRFDVRTYNLISKAMDLFDLTDAEIKQITAQVALVGISTDWLFPANDVKSLTERMKNLGVKSNYCEIVSADGHDAFLSDIAETSKVLRQILTTDKHR